MNKCKEISTVNLPHEEWLRLRREHIGGSDASAIIGMNEYSSPYRVWADKLGLIPHKEDNEAMRIGRDFEQYVADRFTEATGKKVRRKNAILINEDFPFAHANVDRLIVGENAGLECKTTSVLNLKKFSNGEYPATYYVQCVHYMMVTGADRWYLAVLILGKEFKWYCIERDETEIEALRKAEEEFWEMVKKKTQPVPDGKTATSDAIKLIFADSTDEEIDLSLISSAVETRAKLDEQIKELTSLRDEQDNKIKAFMGNASKGICGEHSVSWKTSVRNTFDAKRFMADYPQFDYSLYNKQTQTRTYRFK